MTKNIVKEIPESIKNYKIEKELYKISNITLYSAINTDINEKVLIDIFQKENLKINVNEITFMNNQVFLMKLLNHKNILKLYEIIETKKHAFIVYEYFNGMKLSDYISKKKKLTEEETIIIFKEILSVLVYLHGMYLCDLNLSSNNILIDSKNNIKFCDFKYGHFYSTKEKSKAGFIGDHFFTCPELHSKKNYNPELADMWSCGIILYQMLTGSYPFNSKKDLNLIRSIIVGSYTIPNNVSSNMKNIIKGLIEKNEDKRFKINDLFNQKYFKDKNITKNSLGQGLNILTMKYPIDGVVLNICKNNFEIDVGIMIKSLQNNRFTPITSLFKQIVTKLTNKGMQTINDLISDKFISYVNDHNNDLKEEEQINNIHNYLKKEEDIKKNSKDVAAILLNNQNEISTGLEDLKKQLENAKKGIKPKIRQKSEDFGRIKKKKTYQSDNYKKFLMKMNNQNQNLPKKKNINNIKAVKRNTVLLGDFKAKINKNAIKKGVPKLGNQPGGRFINKDDNNEEKKSFEDIKEEEFKQNENNKKEENDKDDSLNLSQSNSENSIKSNESENSLKKEEKKEEIINVEKEQKIQKDSVNNNVSPQKFENNIEKKSSIKKKTSHGKTNQFNPMFTAKLNKVGVKNNTEQKPKKVIINNQKNDMNEINKKIATNDKKILLNLKKEELEREMNIMKIKNELKKQTNNKNSVEVAKNAQANKKTEAPKVQGFKNIKEMIEANLKKQRVMSNGGLKKKVPGAK